MSVESTIAFLRCAGRAKHENRTGWLERNVVPHPPESIASHMWRMSLICMLCPAGTTGGPGVVGDEATRPLNRDRMMRMALVHDVGETIIGDVSPAMKVPKQVKVDAELHAIQNVLAPLLPAANRAELVELFQEFEAGSTPEARFVRDVDILDMIIQALDYQATTATSLDTFFDSASKISHPWLRALADHTVALFRKTVDQSTVVPVPVTQRIAGSSSIASVSASATATATAPAVTSSHVIVDPAVDQVKPVS